MKKQRIFLALLVAGLQMSALAGDRKAFDRIELSWDEGGRSLSMNVTVGSDGRAVIRLPDGRFIDHALSAKELDALTKSVEDYRANGPKWTNVPVQPGKEGFFLLVKGPGDEEHVARAPLDYYGRGDRVPAVYGVVNSVRDMANAARGTPDTAPKARATDGSLLHEVGGFLGRMVDDVFGDHPKTDAVAVRSDSRGIDTALGEIVSERADAVTHPDAEGR
ncbi:MAG TPA: hypothetical protein VFF73_28920 [Planctomycetota bacterium]|nr:hypothetical protein [Planctomycetota bacterium]